MDWAIYRARGIPASADTGHDGVLRTMTRLSGGRFSTATPKDAIDWAIHAAKTKPAPGSHDVDRRLEAAWRTHNSVDARQLRVARKKGMRHEFGRKLSFSGRLCASGTASLNGVALQRDFVGRTRAWHQAFLLKNACVITEMVGKAIAEVGLVMIIHLMISLMPPSSPRQA